jgi:hypothetical protein
MNNQELIASIQGTIISSLEKETGIALPFEIKVSTNYRKEEIFSLEAEIPQEQLGLLANNFVNAKAVISLEIAEGTVYYRAGFRYEHKDGGSNGINIVNSQGQGFMGVVEVGGDA